MAQSLTYEKGVPIAEVMGTFFALAVLAAFILHFANAKPGGKSGRNC